MTTFLRGALAALFALSALAEADTARALCQRAAEALAEGDADVALDASRRLIGYDSPPDAEAIVALITSDVLDQALPEDAIRVYDHCRRALAAMTSAPAREVVLEALRRGMPEARRVPLVDVLRDWGDVGAMEALLRLARDRTEPEGLRAAAVRALASLRPTDAVVPLIEIVEAEEKSRSFLWHETTTGLEDMLGERATDGKGWREVWESVRPKDGCESFEVYRDGGHTRAPVITYVMYQGARIVYALDVSGSMHKRDPLGDEISPVAPCDECREEHRGVDLPPDRSRMARARRTLEHAISDAPKTAAFNLVAFSHEVRLWKPDLVFSRKAVQLEALEWIRGLEPETTTRTDLALAAIFAEHRHMNTLVLVSDGAPTDAEGKPLTAEAKDDILRAVRGMNFRRRVRIHTHGLEGCDTEFMRRLAEENWGRFCRE